MLAACSGSYFEKFFIHTQGEIDREWIFILGGCSLGGCSLGGCSLGGCSLGGCSLDGCSLLVNGYS